MANFCEKPKAWEQVRRRVIFVFSLIFYKMKASKVMLEMPKKNIKVVFMAFYCLIKAVDLNFLMYKKLGKNIEIFFDYKPIKTSF